MDYKFHDSNVYLLLKIERRVISLSEQFSSSESSCTLPNLQSLSPSHLYATGIHFELFLHLKRPKFPLQAKIHEIMILFVLETCIKY